MPKSRSAHPVHRTHLRLLSRHGHRRQLVTLGDLIAAATQVAGSSEGAARLLDESSPLGHMLDRRIVVH